MDVVSSLRTNLTLQKVRRAERALIDAQRPKAYRVFRAGLYITFYALCVWIFIYALASAPLSVLNPSSYFSYSGGGDVEVGRFFRFGLSEGLAIGILFALIFGPLIRASFYDACDRIYEMAARLRGV